MSCGKHSPTTDFYFLPVYDSEGYTRSPLETRELPRIPPTRYSEPVRDVCAPALLCEIDTIGPFTLAKTKIQKPGFFCCTVYTARKTHSIRGFWHEKRMREKTRISYLCLVSGAHARLLSTFDRTRVVRITSRAASYFSVTQ